MKKLMLVLLAAGICFSGKAQKKNFIVKLIPDPADLKRYDFCIDSVVDNRPIKENIGMAQVGMSNRQVEAVFEDSFEKTLLQFLSVVCQRSEGQKKLVAVFDVLSVNEKTYRMKEVGMADVKITFCIKGDTALYKIGTFVANEESGGMDVTAAHAKRLKSVIVNCLQQLAAKGLTASTEPFTIEGWKATDNEHHILKCTARKKGIYANFEELRSNSPSITDDFTLEPQKDYFKLKDSLGKKIAEPYGVCDGKEIYINTFFYNQSNRKALYAKVKEEGRYLLWLDHYVGLGEGAAMQAAFGVIGRAAAKSGLDCVVLDLKSGIITPINSNSLERLLAKHEDLLQRFHQYRSNISTQQVLIHELNQREKDF